jgi:hypothetical protein
MIVLKLIDTHQYAQVVTTIPFLKDFEQPVENGGSAKNWLVEAFITRRLKWWKDKKREKSQSSRKRKDK